MEHYERINYLSKINTSEYYLEIGVDDGFTFTQVDISYKTGVDPHFSPDSTTILEKSRSGGTLHQTTSDDFFLSIPTDYIYDFVFIDGLHTWDQTYRDLCNTLNHTHENSIILVDDTYPANVFSAMRNQQESLESRKLYNENDTSTNWYGDVYKTIFMVHDFHPLLSYVTIDKNHGNPQTIILKIPRKTFTPKFNSAEKIERVDYFEFVKHKDLLNLMPEQDALNWVREILG
jgi:hypothetical protein